MTSSSVPSLWSPRVRLLVCYHHVWWFSSKKREEPEFTSLDMFVGQIQCYKREYIQPGKSVLSMFLWVCCIFFFHHTALQIVLVLFLWCIKLAHCQLSALCSGSGTKALGQFYFICICCQCNVFILKCPSHIHFSGGLTEVEIVKEGALPHCSLQYCFYAFLPL